MIKNICARCRSPRCMGCTEKASRLDEALMVGFIGALPIFGIVALIIWG